MAQPAFEVGSRAAAHDVHVTSGSPARVLSRCDELVVRGGVLRRWPQRHEGPVVVEQQRQRRPAGRLERGHDLDRRDGVREGMVRRTCRATRRSSIVRAVWKSRAQRGRRGR